MGRGRGKEEKEKGKRLMRPEKAKIFTNWALIKNLC